MQMLTYLQRLPMHNNERQGPEVSEPSLPLIDCSIVDLFCPSGIRVMNHHEPSSSKRQRVGSSTSTGVRTTQRLPLSCVECSRRKIKCDRTIPCRPCIDRGDDRGCRREEVAVKGELQNRAVSPGKRTTFEELVLQVNRLSDRVKELEKGTRFAGTEEANGTSGAPSPVDVDTTRLPGIMEEAALGIGETSRWGEHYPEESRQGGEVYLGWYGPKTLQSGLGVLPSQSQSRALVNLYEENAAWITGSVHLPTLRREQDTFWIQLETNSYRDDIWLALYFAVLSVSAFLVDEDHASIVNMTISQLRNLGRACFDAAIATIFRMDGITHPSIVLCQAVQTLGPAFHFTSNTKLHRSLVPIMTSHARTLNLHLLGKASTREIGKEQEIGRLIWWNIVEPDWSFLPYNRYYSECFMEECLSSSLPGSHLAPSFYHASPHPNFQYTTYVSRSLLPGGQSAVRPFWRPRVGPGPSLRRCHLRIRPDS